MHVICHAYLCIVYPLGDEGGGGGASYTPAAPVPVVLCPLMPGGGVGVGGVPVPATPGPLFVSSGMLVYS